MMSSARTTRRAQPVRSDAEKQIVISRTKVGRLTSDVGISEELRVDLEAVHGNSNHFRILPSAILLPNGTNWRSPSKQLSLRPAISAPIVPTYRIKLHTLRTQNLVAISFTPDELPDGRSATPEVLTLQFPLGWILRNASAAIQYRSLVDVAGFSQHREDYRRLSLSFLPALRLAMAQSGDGTWGGSMLGIPTEGGSQVAGTIPAFRRLLEYGWEKDSPPLIRARRVLFRMLAEDNDVDQLYEFREQAGQDADLIHRSRVMLREAAAAALAHAGYESDPRLRGAARRILARVDTYLSSQLAEKPWVRVGNRQVLAAEAAPPSMYVLAMIAHMPLFRSENHSPVNRLLTYLSQPQPRQEAFQLVGKHILEQPHLVLGDPLASRNIADSDVPFSLTWLELMARLGFLKRNEGWVSLFERFLDDRARDYVWHPHRGTAKPETHNPDVWAQFPLDEGAEGADRWSDVTFRLGLIARLMGRQIETV